jgi:hypothetical protein
LLDSLLQEKMAAIRSILFSVALVSLASQVNGDWISDFGDTLSGAAQSVASTLGDKKTWDQVSAAFESAGDSAANWAEEAWASSADGVKCLKEAGADTDAILACRTNLHSSLGGAAAATFNLFLGAGLAVLLLARVW